MKYLIGYNGNIQVVRWAIISLFLMLLAYIVTGKSDMEVKFSEQTANYQYNYCTGVFQYGIANAALGEQTDNFAKAVEWFQERADATGGHNDEAVKEAVTDLEVLAAQGDQYEFKSVGYRCADIAINERQ